MAPVHQNADPRGTKKKKKTENIAVRKRTNPKMGRSSRQQCTENRRRPVIHSHQPRLCLSLSLCRNHSCMSSHCLSLSCSQDPSHQPPRPTCRTMKVGSPGQTQPHAPGTTPLCLTFEHLRRTRMGDAAPTVGDAQGPLLSLI